MDFTLGSPPRIFLPVRLCSSLMKECPWSVVSPKFEMLPASLVHRKAKTRDKTKVNQKEDIETIEGSYNVIDRKRRHLEVGKWPKQMHDKKISCTSLYLISFHFILQSSWQFENKWNNPQRIAMILKQQKWLQNSAEIREWSWIITGTEEEARGVWKYFRVNFLQFRVSFFRRMDAGVGN